MTLDQFTGINAGYILELYERYQAESRHRSTPPPASCSNRGSRRSRPAPDPTPARGPASHRRRHQPGLVSCAGSATWRRRSTRSGRPRRATRRCRRRSRHHRRGPRALPASLVGGVVAASSTNALEAIEKLRRVYCSSTGFDYLARVRARGARLAAALRRIGPLPAPDGSGELGGPARPHHAGRGVRAVPAEDLPGQDAVLDRRARHDGADPRRDHDGGVRSRHPPRDARHGAPRPAERAGPHAQQAVQPDPRRVQGPDRGAAAAPRSRLDGRREVSRRRPHGPAAGADVRDAGAEPESPRVRESGSSGHGAGGGHDNRPAGCTDLQRRQHAAGADSRRRGLPRPGHRGRDAESVAARWLRHRRHHPHHRQQPAGFHGHAERDATAPATPAAWRVASRFPSCT